MGGRLTSGRLVEELSRYRGVLKQILEGIREEDAHWKPDPDRWSATEIANHLADIEAEDFRTDLDIILNRPEDPWPSFDISEWVIQRRYNEKDYGSSVERFLSERNNSITWIVSLGSIDFKAVHSGKGFRADPMKAGDIMASWIAHDIFHLRQLTLLNWDILRRRSDPYSPEYSGFEA